MQTALIIGATGLIGEALAHTLSTDARYSNIRLLVRRQPSFQLPKNEAVITNFDDLRGLAANIGKGDVLFCCVGTTQSRVKGDKAAYRKVDFDIPVNCAKLALQQGFSKMAIVSAVGANAHSGNFYLKLKGETEEALQEIGFPALHIFRPSLLLGNRKESRAMERFARAVFAPLGSLLIGNLSKYRAIHANNIALAMVNTGASEIRGSHIYYYKEIMTLSKLDQHQE